MVRMKKHAFTLLELMIVVIIVGLLVTLAMPVLQGAVTKTRMTELYPTVKAIENAVILYYYKNGTYPPFGSDMYSVDAAGIENFKTILGVEVPGMDSVLVYAFTRDLGNKILVLTREQESFLCSKYIIGTGPTYEGKWFVSPTHPWAKYLKDLPLIP